MISRFVQQRIDEYAEAERRTFLSLLVVTKGLYKTVFPSVGPSICSAFAFGLLGATYTVYTALFLYLGFRPFAFLIARNIVIVWLFLFIMLILLVLLFSFLLPFSLLLLVLFLLFPLLFFVSIVVVVVVVVRFAFHDFDLLRLLPDFVVSLARILANHRTF